MNVKMKVAITLLFLVYGVIIGINLEPERSSDMTNIYLSLSSETNVQELEDLIRANEDMRIRIGILKQEIAGLELERAESNVTLQMLMQEVQIYQSLAGHQDVQGSGIRILLEGTFEDNIAPLIFQRKYLITLVNELRSNGAEVISVNDHRITARSEMTLAGSHIQVNGRPIAPPYQILAIGHVEALQRYVSHRTFIFDLMRGDGITSAIDFPEEIQITRPHREKGIQFLQIDR